MTNAELTRLQELCRRLLQRAETDPEVAETLADAVARLLDGEPQDKATVRRSGRRAAPALDPFEIYREDRSKLPGRLAELDLEQLRDIVAYYGMDPRRLVMKWKTNERVVAHIVETVDARSRKGDVFRSPPSAG